MKKLIISLLLAVALCSPAFASIAQVTTLAQVAKIIVIPGIHVHTVTIQNSGSTTLRLSFDGGSTYTDPYAFKKGTDPTTSTGYSLPAGQQIIISYASPSMIRQIVAISATGTATIDITTDDTESTFPTT